MSFSMSPKKIFINNIYFISSTQAKLIFFLSVNFGLIVGVSKTKNGVRNLEYLAKDLDLALH